MFFIHKMRSVGEIMAGSAAARVGGSIAGGQTPPFAIDRVTGVLGAEISGLDLTRPLGPDLAAAVMAALAEHKVLFFRDQDMTVEQHLRLGREFGPLDVHWFNTGLSHFSNSQEHPELIRVLSTAEEPVVADRWHSDMTCQVRPPLGSILRSRITPPAGGDTLWADMAAAFEGLDDATRSHISSLVAVHDWHLGREGMRKHGVPEETLVALQAEHPPVEHPLVRTHPVTGEQIIFVNATFTTHIKGMGEAESAALLARLYRLAYTPEYQVRFRWRPNSVAFWDNRSTQHYGAPDFFPHTRMLERVTVSGDRPFYAANPSPKQTQGMTIQ